jgi:hypothetical protein
LVKENLEEGEIREADFIIQELARLGDIHPFKTCEIISQESDGKTWQYIKRPIRLFDWGIDLGTLIDFPLDALILEYKNPYRARLYASQDERITKIAGQVLAFRKQIRLMDLSREEYSFISDYLIWVYRKIGVPLSGVMRFVHNRQDKKKFKAPLVIFPPVPYKRENHFLYTVDPIVLCRRSKLEVTPEMRRLPMEYHGQYVDPVVLDEGCRFTHPVTQSLSLATKMGFVRRTTVMVEYAEEDFWVFLEKLMSGRHSLKFLYDWEVVVSCPEYEYPSWYNAQTLVDIADPNADVMMIDD